MALRDRLLGLLAAPADFTTHTVEGLLRSPTGTLGLGLLSGQKFGDALQLTQQQQASLQQRQLVQQELRRRQAQQAAQNELIGLLGAQGPQMPAGLLGVSPPTSGLLGMDRQMQVAQNETSRSALLDRNRLRGLLARAAPDQFNAAMIDRAFAQPQLTSGQRDLMAAGIDPNSELGRSILLQGVLPQPSGLQAKFATVESALGRKLTDKEILGLSGGGGTTINVGTGKIDEPFSPAELANVRRPDGTGFPIGTTPRQAREAGGKVFTAAELAQQTQLENALGIVAQLKGLAVGDDGVFVGVPDNIIGRAAEAAMNIFGDLAGTDASINRSLYKSLSQGTLAPLARSMGETGALAGPDVQRAFDLLADLEGIPESESVARAKFAELEKIFQRGLEQLSTSDTGNTVDLGGGVTLEFLD